MRQQRVTTHGSGSAAVIAQGPVYIGAGLDPAEASEAKEASAAISLDRVEPAGASNAEWVQPDGIAEGLLSFYTRLFVGRTKERERIRSFATMKDPRYLLVRGIGGVGKSALLSNVVQELRETPVQEGSPTLLYYFIREGHTDPRRLFQSLNLQIIRILRQQEDLETEGSRLEKQFCRLWQQLMTQAGQQRPVLLILDGIDEFPDPAGFRRWLPTDLADYTHVVAGVRTGFDFGRHLPREGPATWPDSLTLSNLARNDIEEILRETLQDAIRASRLAPRVMDLTKGLPAAVRGLARELAERGDSALNRDRVSALIGDYFDSEARDLVEAASDPLSGRVLALLAVADGPLTPADLAQALRVEDHRAIERALRPLNRSLISPTSLEFMHLELKRAVAGHAPQQDVEFSARGLSEWVRSFAGIRGASLIPGYVLDHFVAEMIKADLYVPLFETVLSPRWYAARLAQIGSYLDYADDLSRVRDCADAAARHWPAFCQACYLLAQLRTIATGIPVSLLALLAGLGRLDQAESYVSLITTHTFRSGLLLWLASFYRDRKDLQKSREVLNRAEAALSYVPNPEDRCSLLKRLAAGYRAMNDPAKVKELAEYCRKTIALVQDGWQKRKAVVAAIEASIAAEEFDAAFELAETQRGEYSYDELYLPIALALAARNETERLISSLRYGSDQVWAQIAFGNIARNLAEHGYTAAAKQVAQASENPDTVLVGVCRGIAAHGDIDHSIKTLHEIGVCGLDEASYNRLQRMLLRWRVTRQFILASKTSLRYSTLAAFYRQRALKEILRHFREVIDRDKIVAVAQALASANAISTRLDSLEAYGLLVPWLHERGAADEAARMADTMKEEALKAGELDVEAKARCIVADAFGELDRWQQALEVIEPVLALLEPIDGSVRGRAKHGACRALARCARYDEAFKINDEMASFENRAWALSEIASLMLAHGEQERGDHAARRVLELATQVTPEKSQVTTKTVIAYTYAEFGLTTYAISAAKSISDARERDEAMDTVAFLLLEADAIQGAQEAACAISDYTKRWSRLSSLSRILLRKGNHEGALTTAAQISYDSQRAEALGECAKAILAQCTPYERNRWIERFLREARGFRGLAQLKALGAIGEAALGVHEDARADAIAEEALEEAHSADAVGFRFYLGLAGSCAELGFANAALAILPHWLMEVSEAIPEVARLLAKLRRWAEADTMADRISGLPRLHLIADLAEQAAKRGEEERAREYEARVQHEVELLTARQIPMAQTRLARLRFLLGDRAAATEIAQQAYDSLKQAGDAKALDELSDPLARAGQRSLAVACLTTGTDSRSRAWRETAIAKDLVAAGALADAVEMAQASLAQIEVGDKDSFYDDWVRGDCVEILAKAGEPDLASEVVSAIDKPDARARGLIKIATSYRRAQRASNAEGALQRLAGLLSDSSLTPGTRAAYACVLGRMGRLEDGQVKLKGALRQAERESVETFISTLLAGAPVLAQIDQGETLQAIARGLESCRVLTRHARGFGNREISV
jgi:NACHT domain